MSLEVGKPVESEWIVGKTIETVQMGTFGVQLIFTDGGHAVVNREGSVIVFPPLNERDPNAPPSELLAPDRDTAGP